MVSSTSTTFKVFSSNYGPVNSNLTQLHLPMKVNLDFWGYSGNLSSIPNLINIALHRQIISEVKLPTSSAPEQTYLLDNFKAAIVNDITYNFNNTFSSNQLINSIYNQTIKGTGIGIYKNGTNYTPVDGIKIPMNVIQNALKPYSQDNEYRIHILNFSKLNGNITSNSKHWFYLGKTDTIKYDSQDMRNFGYIDNLSVFYDPTAFAPIFESNTIPKFTNSNILDNSVIQFITKRLNEIIENIFIGTPLSNNYVSLNQKIDVAQITIGSNGNDASFQNLLMSNNFVALKQAILYLLPYYKINFVNIALPLTDFPGLQELLSRYTQRSGNTDIIYVNQNFSENFKSYIRSLKIYSDQNSNNWFYGIALFIDSPNREFVYKTNTGKINQYEYGQIGLGIINFKNYIGNTSLRTSIEPLKKQLEVFGDMFGMANNYSLFSSQLESPYSVYGVTSTWNKNYNYFEKIALAKRMGASLNYTAISNIQSFRSDLRHSLYFWVNRSSLDVAQTALVKGNIFYYKQEFINATNQYYEGFNLWLKAKTEIEDFLTTINNLKYFLIGMFMFGYLIYVMADSTINYNDFKEKYLKIKLK